MLATFGSRAPLESLSPAILFLRPVPPEVLESEGSRRILAALSREAPRTVDQVVAVTSTHRLQKGLEAFSWHHRFEAIDWRTGLSLAGRVLSLDVRPGSIVAESPDEALRIARDWANRTARRLGSEYDVVFGDPRHINHGHAERDGTKVSTVHNWR